MAAVAITGAIVATVRGIGRAIATSAAMAAATQAARPAKWLLKGVKRGATTVLAGAARGTRNTKRSSGAAGVLVPGNTKGASQSQIRLNQLQGQLLDTTMGRGFKGKLARMLVNSITKPEKGTKAWMTRKLFKMAKMKRTNADKMMDRIMDRAHLQQIWRLWLLIRKVLDIHEKLTEDEVNNLLSHPQFAGLILVMDEQLNGRGEKKKVYQSQPPKIPTTAHKRRLVEVTTPGCLKMLTQQQKQQAMTTTETTSRKRGMEKEGTTEATGAKRARA